MPTVWMNSASVADAGWRRPAVGENPGPFHKAATDISAKTINGGAVAHG